VSWLLSEYISHVAHMMWLRKSRRTCNVTHGYTRLIHSAVYEQRCLSPPLAAWMSHIARVDASCFGVKDSCHTGDRAVANLRNTLHEWVIHIALTNEQVMLHEWVIYIAHMDKVGLIPWKNHVQSRMDDEKIKNKHGYGVQCCSRLQRRDAACRCIAVFCRVLQSVAG